VAPSKAMFARMFSGAGDNKSSALYSNFIDLIEFYTAVPLTFDETWKSKRAPSFRTAFFADPESMYFNGLLDTGLRRYDGF